MSIEIKLEGNTVTIYRTRKVSKEERVLYGAKHMVEVVNVSFSEGAPILNVNRDFTSEE